MSQVPKPQRKRKKKLSKLQREKNNPNSGYWMRKCDGLFGKIFHKSNSMCMVGKFCQGNLEMAHLIPRENYLYRWDRNAVVPLCSFHHKYSRELSYHNAPVAFLLWLNENYPIQWNWLETHRKSITRKAELPWTFQDKYNELLLEAHELGIEI